MRRGGIENHHLLIVINEHGIPKKMKELSNIMSLISVEFKRGG